MKCKLQKLFNGKSWFTGINQTRKYHEMTGFPDAKTLWEVNTVVDATLETCGVLAVTAMKLVPQTILLAKLVRPTNAPNFTAVALKAQVQDGKLYWPQEDDSDYEENSVFAQSDTELEGLATTFGWKGRGSVQDWIDKNEGKIIQTVL